ERIIGEPFGNRHDEIALGGVSDGRAFEGYFQAPTAGFPAYRSESSFVHEGFVEAEKLPGGVAFGPGRGPNWRGGWRPVLLPSEGSQNDPVLRFEHAQFFFDSTHRNFREERKSRVSRKFGVRNRASRSASVVLYLCQSISSDP